MKCECQYSIRVIFHTTFLLNKYQFVQEEMKLDFKYCHHENKIAKKKIKK
jgi:hypothetical protein